MLKALGPKAKGKAKAKGAAAAKGQAATPAAAPVKREAQEPVRNKSPKVKTEPED